MFSFVNELGSIVRLNFNPGNSLTGTYTSNVGPHGPITGELIGWFSGSVLAWSVRWPTDPPAITSWVGAFVIGSSQEDIDTMWLLVSTAPNPGDPREFWSQVNTGSDFFKPAVGQ